MGLTTAMYTGLTGLNVNQFRISTIGNNIANVNTTAYKSSRTLFQTQYSHLLSAGNAPRGNSGGVNPTQVGLGAVVGATQRNYNAGSIETTGIPSDLAVEGSGFFVVRRGDGSQAYTRDGSFSVDSDNRLVTIDGHHVMGFGVDEEFNPIPDQLTDLTIPLGTLTVARATESVQMDGDLSAEGTIATRGSTNATQALVNAGGGAAGAGDALTSLRSADNPAAALFSDGATLTLSGATRGGRVIPAQQFVVGQDGSTLGDFAAWMQNALGIQTGEGIPGNPGVTVEDGALVIRSNAGTENAIELTANDLLSDTVGAAIPLQFTETEAANGSSVYTSFTVYDSLGSPVIVNATFTLDDTPDTGPVWRFYLDSPDANGVSTSLGTGIARFDTNGNFVSAEGTQVSLNRSGTGALTPLNFEIDLSAIHGLSTRTSAVIMADQDGYPPGELTQFNVGVDGTINGVFTNGLSRTLGQVALATFPNAEGLVSDSGNLFSQGPNAGQPRISAPGELGAGQVLSGALELSNVDLSNEFIGLITSSTGFQASSRVISTSNDMLDQLLLVIR